MPQFIRNLLRTIGPKLFIPMELPCHFFNKTKTIRKTEKLLEPKSLQEPSDLKYSRTEYHFTFYKKQLIQTLSNNLLCRIIINQFFSSF